MFIRHSAVWMSSRISRRVPGSASIAGTTSMLLSGSSTRGSGCPPVAEPPVAEPPVAAPSAISTS